MGRRNRRAKEPLYDEELLREFQDMEEMRQRKLDGPKIKQMSLKSVVPLTENQTKTFHEYDKNLNLILHGAAGSGKTFIAMYLALKEVIERKYSRLIIVRSAVPTRDIGFLPGTLEEKIAIYQLPYVDICAKLFDIGDAYIRLQKLEYIEFVTTSHVRGMTFDDAIILVDECNNCNFHELDSVITRLGQNSKIVFCGDHAQTDLVGKESQGLIAFMNIVSGMKSFRRIDFTKDDIVRSAIVKEYIIARDKL
jgi:phosphate starvation-inducible protein PhoH